MLESPILYMRVKKETRVKRRGAIRNSPSSRVCRTELLGLKAVSLDNFRRWVAGVPFVTFSGPRPGDAG